MSKIISIVHECPENQYSNDEMEFYMQHLYHFGEKDSKKLNLLYKRSGIDTKYSVLPDFYLHNKERKLFFAEKIPSISERSKVFFEYAPLLCENAILKSINGIIKTTEITHLITVSCTGMSAPGLDLMLVEKLGLKTDIYRTSVNFMGCYASFHAFKLADNICKLDSNAKVVIVAVELCSLHFQPDNDFETIAANLLFADGCAACLVVGDEHEIKGLTFLNFNSRILLEGKTDMAWEISEKGFLMTLSAYIPQLLTSNIQQYINEILAKENIEEIDIWAIHPGGKKILDMFKANLSIEDYKMYDSYENLRSYGNMSSVTILYVLESILNNQKNGNKPSTIFSAAFGPGLTIETSILRYL